MSLSSFWMETYSSYFPLTELPAELIYHVFHFLKVEDLGLVSQVNHTLKRIADDDGNRTDNF